LAKYVIFFIWLGFFFSTSTVITKAYEQCMKIEEEKEHMKHNTFTII